MCRPLASLDVATLADLGEAKGKFSDAQGIKRQRDEDDLYVPRDPEEMQTPRTASAAAAMAALFDGTPATGGLRIGGTPAAVPKFCSPANTAIGATKMGKEYANLLKAREEMQTLSGKLLLCKGEASQLGSELEKEIHADFFQLYALMSQKMEEVVQHERSLMAASEAAFDESLKQVDGCIAQMESVSKTFKQALKEGESGGEEAINRAAADVSVIASKVLEAASQIQEQQQANLESRMPKKRRMNRVLLEQQIASLHCDESIPTPVPQAQLAAPVQMAAPIMEETPVGMASKHMQACTGDNKQPEVHGGEAALQSLPVNAPRQNVEPMNLRLDQMPSELTAQAEPVQIN